MRERRERSKKKTGALKYLALHLHKPLQYQCEITTISSVFTLFQSNILLLIQNLSKFKSWEMAREIRGALLPGYSPEAISCAAVAQ
jgi:hypothetical protein